MGIDKIVVAPDSFKGTMSSIEICDIAEAAIKDILPDTAVVKLPLADGGEGTVDSCLSAVGGRKIDVIVKGPYLNEISSFYAVLPDAKTAVIEMAAASGLLLAGGRKNPMLTSTYGTGQLISHAIDMGCTRLIIGLGGSATNDGGVGMAAALGMRLLDAKGCGIPLNGGGLASLERIDPSGFISRLASCDIILASDVDNTLCGPYGASRVFGPQKGAGLQMVEQLDANLVHYAGIIRRESGKSPDILRGSGAAGGLALPLLAFTNAVMKSGIETVLDITGFDSVIKGADFVITGEGRLDEQSLMGKVPVGVARRAHSKDVRVLVIAGSIACDPHLFYESGITAIFSTARRAGSFEDIRRTCKADLRDTVENLIRFAKMIA